MNTQSGHGHSACRGGIWLDVGFVVERVKRSDPHHQLRKLRLPRLRAAHTQVGGDADDPGVTASRAVYRSTGRAAVFEGR